MGVDLIVIVPVLGRPERVGPFYRNWLEMRGVASELVFVTSPGDEAEFAAIRAVRATALEAPFERGPGDYARKINLGTRWSKTVWPESRFVFAGADDLLFHDGWDAKAVELADETGAGMVGTDDMGNALVVRGLHSTHSLFRRAYIDAVGASWDGPGTVYSEAYDHQWLDNEACVIAMARGAWAFSRESKVEHLHTYWGKSEMDATYEMALAHGAEDAALFRERQKLYG